MNRNRWLAVILIALVLSAGLTYMIFRIVNQRLQPPEETKQIVVATEKLTLGMRISKENVHLAEWPINSTLSGTVSNLEDVLDRGVLETIYPNEPVLDYRLAPREGGAGLPAKIPDGMRALSVRVDNVIGVAGFTLPGTRVDVILTGTPPHKSDVVSRIVLENVEVLTAGQNVQQDANGKPQPVSVVTLLVTPEQAQELVLAGLDRIQLALRNNLDTEQIDPEAVERDVLFVPDKKSETPKTPVKKSISPSRPPVIRPAQPPPPPSNPEPRMIPIEIIRGTNKDIQNFKEQAR